MNNILAVDFEEWYHPEYVKNFVVEKHDLIKQSSQIIINLFEKHDVNASFFIVGEIAEKNIDLIKNISLKGNEIGFHGYSHQLLSQLNFKIFNMELYSFDKLIVKYIKEKPIGYRAPSYSLNNNTKWALKILVKHNYVYDASVFPIKTPLYGINNTPIIPYYPSLKNIINEDNNSKIIEYPASVLKLGNIKIPYSSGFYLRLMPLKFIDKAINKINREGYPAIISFHPWEINPNTPKMHMGIYRNFVTYYNIKNTIIKLNHLLSKYNFLSFKTYLKEEKVI